MIRRIPTHRPIPAVQRYESSETRTEDRKFYNSPAWTKLRARFMRAHPLCQCAENGGEGCGRLAEQVHHIQDRKSRPDLALEWSNLQAMTRACHTAEENRRRL